MFFDILWKGKEKNYYILYIQILVMPVYWTFVLCAGTCWPTTASTSRLSAAPVSRQTVLTRAATSASSAHQLTVPALSPHQLPSPSHVRTKYSHPRIIYLEIVYVYNFYGVYERILLIDI